MSGPVARRHFFKSFFASAPLALSLEEKSLTAQERKSIKKQKRAGRDAGADERFYADCDESVDQVLRSGAIRPEAGFKYALENGADFLCVGMFDFQVRQNADIAGKLLADGLKRRRPWRA